VMIVATGGVEVEAGGTLTLSASGSVMRTWAYGGVSDEGARANCRSSAAPHPLASVERAEIDIPATALLVVLEPIGGGTVLPLGEIRLDEIPDRAKAEWSRCQSVPVVPNSDPANPFAVVVPLEFLRPAQPVSLMVPDSVAPGRWRVRVMEQGTWLRSDEPLLVDVVD
jgi:hypothetical protein